ncbi:MAG: HK97 family phage prohead protease, partial [Chthonomonas sp.]|nr:HK97 family phage prohead protease [Chthonomonas sp.]
MEESQRKLKSLPATLKSANEVEDKGVVEAYVSVFGVRDSYGDVMVFGCFAESLAKKMPKCVWMHRWYEPIGVTIEAREIPAGDTSLPESLRAYGALYVKGQFSLGVQRAKEAFCLIRDGVIDEFSIGYWELESAEITTNGERETHVKKVKLAEWSPVFLGANPHTEPISAKAPGATFADHSEQALGSVQEFTKRAKDYARLKTAEDKKLSPERIKEFRAVYVE